MAINFLNNAIFAGDVTVSGGDITVSNAITGVSGGSFRVKNNGGTTIATFADDLNATFAGNVGIGTTDPTAPLHIEGGTNNEVLKIEADVSPFIRWVKNGSDVGFLQFTSTSAYLSNMSNGSFFFRTNNTDKMTITSAGNVGIGTTNPSSLLTIGANGVSTLKPTVIFTDTTNGSSLVLRGQSPILAFDKTGTGVPKILMDAGGLQFKTGTLDAEGDIDMVILPDGNVGIGTTAPGKKLDVAGDIRTTTRYLVDTGTANENMAIGYWDGNNARIEAGSALPMLITSYQGNIKLGTNGSTTMVVQSNNVGIGTTSPEANLSVVGETSTNNLIGGSINLATSYGWTIPSGTFTQRVGYYGGDFTLNGVAAENSLELGLGPFNDRQLLWTTIGSTDNDADGGWNKTLTNLDIDSSYLSVVYFKRTTSETAGTFYHGTGNNILNLDGTANTNPYFTVRALSGFDQNVWYASVGVIQSNSDSNTVVSPLAGIYRLDTGAKINGANGFKFDTDGATLSRGHRAYLFYSIDVDVVAQFANPGFYKIDGDQPKLHDILGGDNDDVFWSADGDDIYNDNSGNVGIGTTSPDYKLDVEGDISLVGGGENYAIMSPIAGGMQIAVGDPADVATPLVTFVEDQKVGIGTTDPSSLLHLESASSPVLQIKDTTNNVTFKAYAQNSNSHLGNTSNHDLFIDTNNISRVAVKSSGNVGIGVTNPDTKLTIENASGGPASTTFTTTASKANLHLSAVGVPFYNHLFMGIGSATYAWIQAQHGNSIAQNLVLNPIGGNVGIGTTSPQYITEISKPQAGGVGPTLYLHNSINDSSTGHAAEIRFNLRSDEAVTRNAAIKAIAESTYGTSPALTFFTSSGSTGSEEERMRINSSGNVGIGVTNPGSKLDVGGNIKVSGSISMFNGATQVLNISPSGSSAYINTGTSGGTVQFGAPASNTTNINVQGTATATNFILSSDKRLKENIEKVCDNRVKADWKTFELKTEKGEKRYGVIAQELEENHPEFVKTDNEGFKSVKYIDLLIAKIAELEARLEKAGI